jgi:hypothetical protein
MVTSRHSGPRQPPVKLKSCAAAVLALGSAEQNTSVLPLHRDAPGRACELQVFAHPVGGKLVTLTLFATNLDRHRIRLA